MISFHRHRFLVQQQMYLIAEFSRKSVLRSGVGVCRTINSLEDHRNYHSYDLSRRSSINQKNSRHTETNTPPPFTSTISRSLSISGGGTSTKNSADGFHSWTFDKACEKVACTKIHPTTVSICDNSNPSLINAADLIVVGVYAPSTLDDQDAEQNDENKGKEEDVSAMNLVGSAAKFDANNCGGGLSALLEEEIKTFKNGLVAGSVTKTLRLVENGKIKRYALLGLGKAPSENDDDKSMIDESTYSKVGAAIASICDAESAVTTCYIQLPFTLTSGQVSHLTCGMHSNLYSDNRYRSDDKKKHLAEKLESVNISFDDAKASSSESSHNDLADAIEHGITMTRGVFVAKDIVNSPHNVLNSVSLANLARQIADESPNGCIKATILDKKECEKRGMGAYLGVARGSETEPQFIHLTYKPPKNGKINKKVGIVGKGLLFDTGGYNVKTAGMHLMKFDCGGSAAVLGAACAIGQMQPDGVEANFIVPACENMINDRAMVPSDILTASNGKTIEVLNTDAEGRLTLADGLVYADEELNCEKIIELSTLTGACMVSLGTSVSGVWTSSDSLAEELDDVSKSTGEKSWRMPLVEEYNEQLESKIADISNLGGPYGGAITAALFLQHFIKDTKKTPYAHIDIAGPVWNDKTGATGYGAKLVAEWVRRQGLEGKD
eukprot:CAMPEP_0194447566 /NCGR_PEP_ID=MMETSP0176-20130528/129079_1 /TAXON_ID=216777 /ORGANISM="Proboscia alata, Strain PI-D3" /LENGTH=665 /DNA_ID=CAMNT_0039274433 /DNA_START=48 /DNA_END=2045 /DNA_ORIENTATION=+